MQGFGSAAKDLEFGAVGGPKGDNACAVVEILIIVGGEFGADATKLGADDGMELFVPALLFVIFEAIAKDIEVFVIYSIELDDELFTGGVVEAGPDGVEEFVGAGGFEDAVEVWVGNVFDKNVAANIAAENGSALNVIAAALGESGVVFEGGVGGVEDAGADGGQIEVSDNGLHLFGWLETAAAGPVGDGGEVDEKVEPESYEDNDYGWDESEKAGFWLGGLRMILCSLVRFCARQRPVRGCFCLGIWVARDWRIIIMW